MNIDWEKIYIEKSQGKFHHLPKIFPWAETMEENVHLTLEWLVRDARDVTVRFSEEPILNLIKDNWFRAEFEEGRFFHICYPEDMLKFRSQYESLWLQLKAMPDTKNISLYFNLNKRATEQLWNAFNCFGGDGMIEYEEYVPGKVYDFAGERVWHNQCSRCCEPLPKALRMWVKLQHSILKDAV